MESKTSYTELKEYILNNKDELKAFVSANKKFFQGYVEKAINYANFYKLGPASQKDKELDEMWSNEFGEIEKEITLEDSKKAKKSKISKGVVYPVLGALTAGLAIASAGCIEILDVPEKPVFDSYGIINEIQKVNGSFEHTDFDDKIIVNYYDQVDQINETKTIFGDHTQYNLTELINELSAGDMVKIVNDKEMAGAIKEIYQLTNETEFLQKSKQERESKAPRIEDYELKKGESDTTNFNCNIAMIAGLGLVGGLIAFGLFGRRD
jgi:hypothetical protein